MHIKKLCSLIFILLCSHEINLFAEVTYRLDSSWNTGFQGTFIIRNETAAVLTNWALEFDLAHNITSYWNGTLKNHVNNHYSFGAPSWKSDINPGEVIEIGFVAQANGTITNPTNYRLSSTSSAGGNTNPNPPPTTQVPAKPVVSVQQSSQNGSYDISWNIYYGSKGTSWQLLENGNVIHSAPLQNADNNSTQSGLFTVTNRHYGIYRYQVIITNSAGSTNSDIVTHLVGGASPIEIKEIDSNTQELQYTMNQESRDFTVAMANTANPQFEVMTNNNTVIAPELIGPSSVRITGLKAGRASLRIKEKTSGAIRYIGIRVKHSDNSLPGLPAYLSLGSVSEDTPDHLTFWRSFDNGLKNKRIDIRYIYINGGPFIGWRTWSNTDGGRAISYIRESKKLGIIPFFVYYNIPDGGESYYTDRQHIEDKQYMEAYFKDLKFFLDIVRNEGGDELVGIILEPDFIGYMMQNSNGTNPLSPTQIFAQTNSVYSSGVLNESQDPVFANNLQGLVQAINYTIARYAPNAQFGWQINLWASPGITTSIGSGGLMRKTDSEGIEQGRKAIVSEARVIADYYKDAGIVSHGASFISIDKYGLDAGISSPDNPQNSTWFWHADHWNNYMLFAQALKETAQLPVMLWQIPVGHINSSLSINPYSGSVFTPLNNTSKHYEDSAPTFMLGDVFKPGNRFNYFKTNLGNDPKIIPLDGSTLEWKDHMNELSDHGIIAVLFGAGVGDSTQGVGNPPTDDHWWIVKAQHYYQTLGS